LIGPFHFLSTSYQPTLETAGGKAGVEAQEGSLDHSHSKKGTAFSYLHDNPVRPFYFSPLQEISGIAHVL
jgi:hypothetical protein